MVVVSRNSRSRSSGHASGTRKHGHLHAGAALLHLHGGAVDVPGAGFEQQFADVGQQLGGGVVDHGFNDGDWLGVGAVG